MDTIFNASLIEEDHFNVTEHRGFIHGFVEALSVILVSILLGVNRLISVYRCTRPEVDQGSFSLKNLRYESYAVSVGQPGDLNSRISGFSSEVDHGS